MNKKKAVLFALLIASFFATRTQAQQGAPGSKTNHEKSKQSTDLDEFIKRNPMVSAVSWKKENKIIITSRDGKEQAYNMSNAQERKSFEDKYGTAPVAPPPPPPPPPAPSAPIELKF